ncbi:MAG: class E sortase [Candidatus Kerfeldbacteria bacterium]|nr:class E sortase [Candidatus Kerfeldbacteria bacterium]
MNSPRPRSWWWRRRRPTRLVLSLASLLLGTTILAIPFAPWILYHTFKLEPSFPYATRLAGTNLLPNVSDAAKPLPAGNRLVIPKIGVDVEIIDGQDERALWRGIWRLPQTSSPDRGGNTVLTGHRFQYLAGPRTLYLLDQLVTGDLIIVYWKGAEYDYRVFGRRIVNPNAVEILNDTSKPQLTVFTCTPVFSTKQRLVLFAEPIVTAQPDYLTP